MLSGVLIFNIGFFLVGGIHSIGIDYIIGILVILLGFAYATIQNDIEDLAIDKVNSPSKALASGKLSIEEASAFNNIILVGLLALSLYHFPHHLIFVLMLGLIWLYNKPPFFLSRRPIASIVVLALAYSTVPLLYGYYLNFGLALNSDLLYLVLLWFLVRISIAILKDYKDARGDKAYNKRTFYLTYGHRYTALVSIICFSVGCVGILFLLFLLRTPHWLFILPALFLIRNFYLRLQLFRTMNNKKLTDIFHQIFFGQNQFDFAFLLCLLLLK